MGVHPKSNEEVFQATVRALLRAGGVPVIEQNLDSLLNALEHGEGGVETCLNLVVRAHVKRLMVGVWTPFGKDAWVGESEAEDMRIAEALERCHQYLVLRKGEYKADTSGLDIWWAIVPLMYKLRGWVDLEGSGFFKLDLNLQVIEDASILYSIRDGQIEKAVDCILEGINSFRSFTPTHKLLVASVIDRVIAQQNELSLDAWSNLVDICANWLAYSEQAEEEYVEFVGDSTRPSVPPTSADFWAWQFGRVSALAQGRARVPAEADEDFDYFALWENGRVALGLAALASKSPDWARDSLQLLLVVTSPYEKEKAAQGTAHFRSRGTMPNPVPDEVAEVRVSSHLHWLMQLGALDAVLQMERQALAAETGSVEEPADSDIMLIGPPGRLAEVFHMALELRERQRRDQAEAELKNHLDKVWDELPEDSKEHLLDAELDRRGRKRKDASLNYANAVEVALREWALPLAPRWKGPQQLGDWIGLLRELTRAGRIEVGMADLRRRLDLHYVRALVDVLDMFSQARLPGAHGLHCSPLTEEVRSKALGIEGQSVFELILRLVRRWPEQRKERG